MFHTIYHYLYFDLYITCTIQLCYILSNRGKYDYLNVIGLVHPGLVNIWGRLPVLDRSEGWKWVEIKLKNKSHINPSINERIKLHEVQDVLSNGFKAGTKKSLILAIDFEKNSPVFIKLENTIHSYSLNIDCGFYQGRIYMQQRIEANLSNLHKQNHY